VVGVAVHRKPVATTEEAQELAHLTGLEGASIGWIADSGVREDTQDGAG
jgi:hypothetical protein